MNSQKLRHVILTRFNLGLYDSPGADEWMEHRLPFFEKTRESVLSQKGDFEWWLAVDSRTPGWWLKKIFTDPRMHITNEHPKEFRCDGWTITTRLDNDDLYLPGAIKAIQSRFTHKEMVIDLRYSQLCDGVYYTSGIERDGWERQQPNSPFLSLIENGVTKTCYVRPHSRMLQIAKGIFASNDRLAVMVVHDRNLGNKIIGRKI